MKKAPLYILLVLLVASCTNAIAQKYSYVYIQGDKQTPFYVKMDDKMMPRYAKNYTILPKLHSGEVNIEILFQQNVYPAQKFTINVPENSHRGFLLNKQNDAFVLYDLDTKTYLNTNKKTN